MRLIILLTLSFQCFADVLDTDFDSYEKYRQFLLKGIVPIVNLKSIKLSNSRVQHRYNHIKQGQRSHGIQMTLELIVKFPTCPYT